MDKNGNKTFRDFKGLKGLLSSSTPQEQQRRSRVREIPESRPVKTVSPAPIPVPELEHGSSEGLVVGGRAVLMDGDVRGRIISMDAHSALLRTDDGLEMRFTLTELVPSSRSEEHALKESAVTAKSEDFQKDRRGGDSRCLTVDLHIEALPGGREVPENERLEYQLSWFRKTLRDNLCHRGFHIIFIHGVGDGVLKNAVRRELDEVFALRCTYSYNHSGATAVTIL